MDMPEQHPSFDMCLFGGNGDLALRKLLPALYYCELDESVNPEGRIIGIARADLDHQTYLGQVREACERYVPAADFNENVWERFARRISYLRLDISQADDYQALKALLEPHPERVRVYYLATAPNLFTVAVEQLAAAGLINPQCRVVLEKPLGHDLESSQAINSRVLSVLDESQVFRIDHYLGKETVQNLMAMRFANMLFEPVWRREWVRSVQITVAENIGVGGRGGYYDRSGALRDMVQNHLLQLLCLVSMEPPTSVDPDAVRDEKLKILRALRPLQGQQALDNSVRGQYSAGAIDGQPVIGYLEEEGIPADSTTESFVALRAHIDNWRWADVPFYLRTGKRMPAKRSEIVLNFRKLPHNIFSAQEQFTNPNRLVIRLEPDDGITLRILAKKPGPALKLSPVELDLDFAHSFKSRRLDAYERLLRDIIDGRLTLFMRRDESEAAWAWIEPILQAWQDQDKKPYSYVAGSWGPPAAVRLAGADGHTWPEEVE
ncbi:MAG: glucose-6-phosphate dehydrogenase [Wenzhouxiangellaceae bacterium]